MTVAETTDPRIRAARLLEVARQSDPKGDRVQIVLAMLLLFTMSLTTAPSGIAFAALAVYTILRLHKTSACYEPVLRTPLLRIALVWVIWCAVTIFWSSSPEQGFDELSSTRMLLLPLLLWPVINRGPWLIVAVLAGVLVQNGVQLIHALNLTDALRHGEGLRVGGLLHPIQTGVLCSCAVCWYLSAIIHEKSWRRWGAVVLAGIAFAGLIATGSRGPWLALAVALPLQVILIVIRRPAARKAALIATICGILAGVVVMFLGYRMISERFEDAKTEFRAAIEEGDYGTSVGLRIGLWSWAWNTFREKPLLGHGLGSFREVMITQPSYMKAEERWPEHAVEYMQRDHAHSSYLHLLSSTGIFGAAFFVALLIMALIGAWRSPLDHPFADGVLPALVVWIIAAQFDALHLNAHMLGLLMFLVMLSLPVRPRYIDESAVMD
ncbi:MAG: O-antigen ligase family protein [Planctomycetes bacterium]|nr:O-antigen ligase family protein [Planctomycetota bacterium]